MTDKLSHDELYLMKCLSVAGAYAIKTDKHLWVIWDKWSYDMTTYVPQYEALTEQGFIDRGELTVSGRKAYINER